MTQAFAPLALELEALFARGVDAPLSDVEFGRLAWRIFAHQFEACAPYRALCRARGVTPGSVERWQDVPAVPATAFKHLDLLSAEAPPEAVFRTSGTTRGAEARGRHLVPRLSLYRASLRPNFSAHLLPEGEALPLLSLIPAPAALPDSSLSAMVGEVADTFAEGVTWLSDPERGPDADALLAAAASLEEGARPALVVGTAFALVHLLDALRASGRRARLPEGTRLMETGGFKGRSRSVSREELYAGVRDLLGVPVHRIVNEYGMTELLSQLYEPVLREGPEAPRRHVPPPWLRVRALDPITLEPVEEGRPGLLAFFDLANAGSVAHVLTEDVGTVTGAGVHLAGRAHGAEPRGCSMLLEELLATAGRGR